MRLDYISYAIAIVFFIITLAAVVNSSGLQQHVWVVSTVVIGLAFIGVGYTQRPRSAAAPPVTTSVPPPPPSEPQRPQEQVQQQQQVPEVTTALSQPVSQPIATEQPVTEQPTVTEQPIVTDVVKMEETKPVVQSVPLVPGGLTDVKGIGEKRAAQLRALGINSVEDLAKASAKDLATKLNISPKITDKWIQNAKEIEQSP